MNGFRIILHLGWADFLDRTRRYSFLITLGLTILAAYTFLPAANANYVALDLGGYRGLYNSAWVGSSMAVLTSYFLSLVGFYLVKNAIERDYQTGVGQIIATTPLSKLVYVLGKTLSNFAVLALIVGLVLVAAGVVQFVRGEDLRFDLEALIIPFLVVTLPAMAVVAAAAVLFETLPGLRSGLGNIVYFFAWFMVLGVEGAVIIFGIGSLAAAVDPLGVAIPILNMLAVARTLPGNNGSINVGPYPLEGGPLRTFRWEGMHWTADLILMRLMWFGLALAIVLLASRFFDRFAAPRAIAVGRAASQKSNGFRKATPRTNALAVPPGRLSALPASVRRFRFGQVFQAELRLLLKGQRWWWYAGVAVIAFGALLSPAEAARLGWLPAAWIWPILIWSNLGIREERHGTSQFVFSAPHPLLRQLPATWLSGFFLSLVTGSGAALTSLRSGDWAALGAWLAGAMFIPSLALALGIWSNSSKLFEVIYVMWWYLGPLHPLEVPWLDFVGAGNTAITLGMPLVYLALAALLFGLAVVGRWRRVRP